MIIPKFIVLEGLDGVGKTTAGQLLAQTLGYEYTESTRPEFRSVIDSLEKTVNFNAYHMLYMTSLKHTSDYVKKVLESKKGVVCCRWFYTSIIAQRIKAEAMNIGDAIRLDVSQFDFLTPDKLVFLYADEKTLLNRLVSRGSLNMNDTMGHKLKIFNQLVAAYREYNPIEVDTCDLSPDEVVSTILKKIIA